MKKIFPKEWMALHPYTHTDSEDYYYTNIANRIYSYLHTSPIAEGFRDDEDVRKLSLRLTAWLEDIVSQTGIWATFTAECKKRHGTYLPFYPLGENYFADEINPEDVRFILWHHLQYFKNNESIINPENHSIAMTADVIYSILAKEYEIAPENERMQAFLCEPDFGEEDFYKYKEVLEWFHYQCYFNIENEDETLAVQTDFLEENQIKEAQEVNRIKYGIRMEYMMSGRKSLLSLTSYEWLARIWKESPQHALFEKVEWYESNIFLCDREDDEFLYVKDLSANDAELKIVKKSLSISSANKIPGVSLLFCNLLYYGKGWWQCSFMTVEKWNKEWKEHIEEEKKIRNKENEKAVYEEFLKATGGKPLFFCKSKEEIISFISSNLGYNLLNKLNISQLNMAKRALIFATPTSGLSIQFKLCECIKSPDNPFYDKKIAEEQAVSFILNPSVVPYEFSRMLQDLNFLPDAGLNSVKGKEYGKKLLHANSVFLTDYFHKKNREKDLTVEA